MIITSPETIHNSKETFNYLPGVTKTVFVAGGITGAPNWQPDFCKAIDSPFWIIFDPRRKTPIAWEASKDANDQIEWEYNNLKYTDIVIFWFPKDAKCVITLFELGKELGRAENADRPKKIIVGVESGFYREFDVMKQISMSGINVPVFQTLESMADYVNSMKK